ncbi:MAG: stage II sporulation protein M [Candidatus Pacearchaeota archaeon]
MKKRKDKKENNFFYKIYSESSEYLTVSKKYIYSSFFLFFLFVSVGIIFKTPPILEQKILSYLESILEQTEGMSYPELVGFIFLNNTQTSFFGIFLGVFAGFFPFIILIFNGYILGFVISRFIEVGGVNNIFQVLWRLAPHGVFELPAVFISIGLGLKLGLPLIYRYFKHYLDTENVLAIFLGIFFLLPSLIIAVFIDRNLRKTQFVDFDFKLRNSLKIFVFVVIPLLIIAALIEGGLIFLLKN